METYPNPYFRAKALLAELETFAMSRSFPLPGTRYAQIGDVVRDCESVIVSVGNLVPDPLYDPVECVSPRLATFLVEIIRSCAITYENDGTTNVKALQQVSERGGMDGQFLYDFAQTIDGWSSKQPWTVVWSFSEGGLQVASLQVTMGIP